MAAILLLGFIMLLGLSAMSVVFYLRARALEKEQRQLPPGYGSAGFTPVKQLTDQRGGGGMTSTGGNEDRANLLNLRLGDIVSYFGADYIIEGKMNYWDGGYTWVSYMLVDGSSLRWLSVEEDDELEVALWDKVTDLVLTAPLPATVTYHGESFRKTQEGEARVNQEGKSSGKTGLSMRYAQYQGEAGGALSVEQWGSEIEVSVGEQVRPEALDILPGDEVEL